jgi:VWFA-related protein
MGLGANIAGHGNRLPRFSVYAHTMSLRGISPTKRAAPLRATLPTLLFLVSGTTSVLFAQKPALNTSPAQTSEPAPQGAPAAAAPTISVDAKLVNIPVIVLDKKGALVQNLTKDSFVLKVDGHDQTIRYFNQDKDLPLTIGLLVDTSQSQRSVLEDERSASIAFLDDMLTGRDKAFIVQFAHQTDLLQDVTSSKPKLQQGLKQLDASSSGGTPSFGGNGGGRGDDSDSNGGNGRARGGRGTTLYDALFLSSDEIQAKQTGRKAVVILSDGVDSGSMESLARTIEAAQRADTIVYAIYYKGRDYGGNRDQDRQGGPGGGRRGGIGGGYPGGGGGYPGGGGGYPGSGGQGRPQGGNESHVDGRKILQRMADETGGRLFEVKGKETVASIYKEIGEELRAQYRLGYTPDKAGSSDGYHKIDLELTPASLKNLYIQRRDGYYMGKE